MKKLLTSLAALVLSLVAATAQTEWIVENTNPISGLRTGNIFVNGEIYQIQPFTDLRSADLSGADLSSADLSSADLSSADLSGADLSGEADLSGANLSGTNLSGTNLVWADLRRVDLTGAILENVIRETLDLSNLAQIRALQNSQVPAGGISPEQAAAIQSNTNEISELKTMMAAVSVQLQQLNTQLGELQASIDEKDEQIAELSQRPTLEEIQDARTGSLVFRADQKTNLVTLDFEVQVSENLQDWTAQPERVTATLPLDAGKKFVRIALVQD